MFELDDSRTPERTVLLFSIRYPWHPDRKKTWTYVALKVEGRWYMTGSGRVLQDAGWGRVKSWLSENGRQLVSVESASMRTQIWPDDGEEEIPVEEIVRITRMIRDAWNVSMIHVRGAAVTTVDGIALI